MEKDWGIEHFAWDRWETQAKVDAEMMRQGKMPPVMHLPTEMLSIEEVIERYGWALSNEEIQKLKEQVKR